MSKKFHRAFGVYGIISDNSNLVVIKKNGGPYINRYDLPGGSLDDGEPLNNAIIREIKEETQLDATDVMQLGITSFRYPWKYEKWNYNQHICVFYDVNKYDGKISNTVDQFVGQDSLGGLSIGLDELTYENSSPLVMKAKEYIENGREFNSADEFFDKWKILKKQVF
ncbi:NUDIX hydrolase [Companilactobacillus hulinensis]|uniref:NUDIX hydrolase n=1 Tax=Companilactobacillus hulinensis TaxID=2486007 RepID=UPI000F78464D|nr:NUDIX hydrolase [Companilactobacillus hulinensis]